MKQRLRLKIKGIVQGVGFRPYVYNLARRLEVVGFVCNDTSGVTVEIEGENIRVKKFLKELKSNPPIASVVDTVKEEYLGVQGTKNFMITNSLVGQDKFTFISYDIAVCSSCLKELFSKTDRRYLYPFINCTHCGPRFTIIKDIPYDRPHTTMADFRMCPECSYEYKDRLKRRFHAQPNACFSCGPQIALLKQPKVIKYGDNSFAKTQNTLAKAAKLISDGNILAIKGIGGYHLCCNAKNTSTVNKLRLRKDRARKPLAVMVDDTKTIERICFLSRKEKKLLLSPGSPIVLLKTKRQPAWLEAIAPKQKYLGVMFAYTPLHYLIFYHLRKYERRSILVMTSANKKDFPLVSEEEELYQLRDYADYFIVHNRPIQIACDDSIARVFNGKEIMVRKARGYTPDFSELRNRKNILGCGAELKNTFSLAKGGYLLTSSYTGDLKHYKNYDFFLKLIKHYQKLFSFEPEVVAYDCHPDYLSTQYAISLKNKQKISVQHHHAHLAACLFENNLREKTIGVCFDGVGFGLDNTAWGGEFFIADRKTFIRAGHFKYLGLLGADRAIEAPARTALYVLYEIFKGKPEKFCLPPIKFFSKKEKSIFLQLIQAKEFGLSSSAGRLFDAASSILGLCHKITYEAEAAVLLEMFATKPQSKIENFDFSIRKEKNCYIIDWQPLFSSLINDIRLKKDYAHLAYKFHFTFAVIIREMAEILRKDYNLNKVALSGGVFQNMLLLELAIKLLEKEGFSVYYHRRFPFNDSAISVGQVVVANENI